MTLPRPTNDLVLLEVLDSEVQFAPVDIKAARAEGELTVHPIELVASLSDRLYKRARVVAVGPGRRHPKTDARLPVFVEPGDLVVYEDWRVDWHDGIATWPGPGDHALVRADAIVGVVEDPDAWIDFPRHYGAESPPLPDHAFDPQAAGGGTRDGGAGALKRWGIG